MFLPLLLCLTLFCLFSFFFTWVYFFLFLSWQFTVLAPGLHLLSCLVLIEVPRYQYLLLSWLDTHFNSAIFCICLNLVWLIFVFSVCAILILIFLVTIYITISIYCKLFTPLIGWTWSHWIVFCGTSVPFNWSWCSNLFLLCLCWQCSC